MTMVLLFLHPPCGALPRQTPAPAGRSGRPRFSLVG
eukprot:COSAG01_NODE_60426_length_295_cov_0.265306_1_plen_35_part_01